MVSKLFKHYKLDFEFHEFFFCKNRELFDGLYNQICIFVILQYDFRFKIRNSLTDGSLDIRYNHW